MVHAPGRITLWGVEVFVATAEEGSVTAAARRLGASASAVSQQLAGLEQSVSAVLMDRSSRPVTLTPSGKVFLRRARNILAEAQRARAELAGDGLAALTDLRLGVIEDFDADVTPRLLSEMSTELKSCQFLLETGASHRLLDQLDARALDVVITAEMGAPADWMDVHPLLAEPFIAAVPADFKCNGDTLSALRALPLVQYTERHVMGRQISAHLAQQSISLAHRFELDSYHAILAMVSAGLGWTILTPLGYLRAHRFRHAAKPIPLPLPSMSRRIILSARKDALGEMPREIATRMRPLLSEMIVAPACAEMPWLDGKLKLL